MAGHSKWSQIKRKKAILDSKRGQIFTKIIKEITIASRMGGGDEDANPRLRQAITNAKGANMPLNNIKKAILKGTGELPGVSYEEIIFEGYGPGGVAIMIEVATDNRKRTVAELRYLISKNGGNLGESGCVSWMFKRKGNIIINKSNINEEKLMELFINFNVLDFTEENDIFIVETKPEEMNKFLKTLEQNNYKIISSEILQVSDNTVSIDDDIYNKIINLFEKLDEHEDVQKIHSNFEIK
ncbi:MAG: YebC/PmpR family DNA-binding transcriptional regulator [Candidatus Marinimicrobia bacterium]|nr:YebC/PmpR family DNA-binding transcriptional regulator [Candidatus Neomarinimicrobiota bacterium]OUW50641.1 MAG: YebC/PmpR family DNA-binding transcriptional regulator [bacterium TMED190]|tara:strand:+ start:1939 stop:2661 length:723 start_codon:yes stop_codon:yes gene_type:complete